ncbi:hypothetical protein JYJ95_12260 [Corallococcus exiguus]|uniref:hypothetical protein n=1 Tax=Corallococcus exiguus TaxID=83462 RepID=UPI001A8F35D6|nr:hypothetical protein [Corallococcus exiguus]MBN8467290.1 hypothetical protein [Corallococcus exiguus]
MMRWCHLLVLGLTLSCAERPPPPAPRTWPRSQNFRLGTVTSVQRVHITQGFKVLRGDTQEEVTVHEGLLINLQGLSWTEFMPRAMAPPSLVQGDSYVVMILDPFSFRPTTVLLTEAPPPGTEVGLWMTLPWEGGMPRGAEFKKAQARELGPKGSGVNIQTPAAEAPVSSYLSLEVLEEEVRGRGSMNGVHAPELCASIHVACGFKETLHGRIDCGVCPQGQSCTADNTCCTPATCASLGRSCGTVVPDGCGYSLDCGACPVR